MLNGYIVRRWSRSKNSDDVVCGEAFAAAAMFVPEFLRDRHEFRCRSFPNGESHVEEEDVGAVGRGEVKHFIGICASAPDRLELGISPGEVIPLHTFKGKGVIYSLM
jgi:hypothetical protein